MLEQQECFWCTNWATCAIEEREYCEWCFITPLTMLIFALKDMGLLQ